MGLQEGLELAADEVGHGDEVAIGAHDAPEGHKLRRDLGEAQ
jgi:hypothetical protein